MKYQRSIYRGLSENHREKDVRRQDIKKLLIWSSTGWSQKCNNFFFKKDGRTNLRYWFLRLMSMYWVHFGYFDMLQWLITILPFVSDQIPDCLWFLSFHCPRAVDGNEYDSNSYNNDIADVQMMINIKQTLPPWFHIFDWFCWRWWQMMINNSTENYNKDVFETTVAIWFEVYGSLFVLSLGADDDD